MKKFKYKSLNVTLDDEDRPIRSFVNTKPHIFYANPGAGSIDQIAKDAVDLLKMNTGYDECVVPFSSFFGVFEIDIPRDYSYEDAVEYARALLKIQEMVATRKDAVKKKIQKNIIQRKKEQSTNTTL